MLLYDKFKQNDLNQINIKNNILKIYIKCELILFYIIIIFIIIIIITSTILLVYLL